MAKYEVTHSLISGTDKNYHMGDVLEEAEIEAAGMNLAFLRRAGAVRPLKGTGEVDDEADLLDPLQGTDPTPPGAQPPLLGRASLAPATGAAAGTVSVTRAQFEEAVEAAVDERAKSLQSDNDALKAQLAEQAKLLADRDKAAQQAQSDNDALKAQLVAKGAQPKGAGDTGGQQS